MAYAFSTQTLSLRLDGATALTESLKLLYTAEYASQSDYQDNPEDYTADYYHLIGGLLAPISDSTVKTISGKIACEFLGAENNVSYKNPLGTNHAFMAGLISF